ncbi:MAG: amidohydrolase [Mogibacterium sp.]|nr:amidohydrolase [Mogibacterium sp.]
MHACGHDAHTAVLLAMVRFFAAHRELIRGKIKFIFQQAEEKLPGGAVTLCREGVMEDVDEIYAWHAAAIQPIGEVSLVRGHSHAAVGEYRLVIKGKGGHGGFPHLSNNPILCAASVANIINQMITTRVDPLKSGVITTAYIHSGTDHVPNVIPSECILGGNIRTLDNALIEKMYEWTEQICRTQCEAFGCEYEFEIGRGYPSTELGGHPMEVMEAVAAEMGLVNTIPFPQMGAEDFSYYTLKKPAAFIMIGMQDPRDKENPTPHHNPRFRIDDENGLPVALEFIVSCYLKAVS